MSEGMVITLISSDEGFDAKLKIVDQLLKTVTMST